MNLAMHPPSYWLAPPFAVKREPITPEQIISVVCRYYDMDRTMLDRYCRMPDIVKCRQVSWYMIRKILPNVSLKSMGRMFSKGYDHTTVIHSITTVQNMVDSYPDYHEEMETIERIIKT